MSKEYTYYTYSDDGQPVAKTVSDLKDDGMVMAMDSIIDRYGSFEQAPDELVEAFRDKYFQREPIHRKRSKRWEVNERKERLNVDMSGKVGQPYRPKPKPDNYLNVVNAYRPMPTNKAVDLMPVMVDDSMPVRTTNSLKYYYCYLDVLQGISKEDVLRYRHLTNRAFFSHGADVYKVYYTYMNVWSGKEYTGGSISDVMAQLRETTDRGPTSHRRWDEAYQRGDHSYLWHTRLQGKVGQYIRLRPVRLKPRAKEKFLELLEASLPNQFAVEAFIGKYIGSKGAKL